MEEVGVQAVQFAAESDEPPTPVECGAGRRELVGDQWEVVVGEGGTESGGEFLDVPADTSRRHRQRRAIDRDSQTLLF